MTGLVVTTRAGAVRGAEIADGVLAWKGIPYAAPPVGELRWALPQPHAGWAGVRDALAYGAPAPQPPAPAAPEPDVRGIVPRGALPAPDEDCLVLNVTAPADAVSLPVIVWIHGGGFQGGTGTDGPGDGSRFASAQRAVVVSVNYRLGSLGFLALPDAGPTGSYGLHDQVAALAWVRDNIAGFGGDPARVTVAGHSAGAKSVASLLASPLTTGMIAGAVSLSGGGDFVSTPEHDARLRVRFLGELGLPDDAPVARVRTVPVADLVAAQDALARGPRGTWIWRPSIDGVVLERVPVDAIAAGAAAGIALLAQHTVLECLLYDALVPRSPEHADRVLAEALGDDEVARLLAAYATARPELADDPHRLRVEVFSDERYVVPTSRLADAQSNHAPVYRARFDGPVPALPFPGIPDGPMPATHGSDVMPVWFGIGPGGRALSDAVGSFVATGAPRAEALPSWEGYDEDSRATMVIREASGAMTSDPHGGQRAAWDGHAWTPGTWWPIAGL
ncbi:carboxylesterase/lipase family protein [Demequina salsinemoris]|uniref:carboxylesterase/lipase family protein n=1 Tax=Demequina salsinemoris TaxID=577470 RepID=UPI000783CF9B|nr:carboxylesterase family protein [Demequina salsinemoris]